MPTSACIWWLRRHWNSKPTRQLGDCCRIPIKPWVQMIMSGHVPFANKVEHKLSLNSALNSPVFLSESRPHSSKLVAATHTSWLLHFNFWVGKIITLCVEFCFTIRSQALLMLEHLTVSSTYNGQRQWNESHLHDWQCWKLIWELGRQAARLSRIVYIFLVITLSTCHYIEAVAVFFAAKVWK